MSSVEALQTIIHDISTGFDVLVNRLDTQKRTESDLRQKLARAVEKYNSNISEDPSDGSLSAWQDEIVKHLSPLTKDPFSLNTNIPSEVTKARDVINKLKVDMAAPTTRRCPVTHKSSVPKERAIATPTTTPGKCPVAHKPPPSAYDEMEQDFTTQGKPSSLECPFAEMSKNGLMDVTGLRDPIAAEFHADSLSAQSLDESRACGRCPIRFLDKHAPEEVAEYFEKHKHELPRSHEICVKRYQTNENQIRQLDAKYGNIVSMIQGLGNKHKQYLPSDEQAGSNDDDQKSTAAVEKWAHSVDKASDTVDPVEETDQRLSHFEKPLRDVRVGESPTRPWGIHVPADRSKAASTISSKPPPVTSNDSPSPMVPMLDGVTSQTETSRHTASQTTSRRNRDRRPNQIIFNGPVFMGYSPEQAAQFLNQIGAGRGMP